MILLIKGRPLGSEGVEKLGVKSQCSTEEGKLLFDLSYQEVEKIDCSRNRDSTVSIINATCRSVLPLF